MALSAVFQGAPPTNPSPACPQAHTGVQVCVPQHQTARFAVLGEEVPVESPVCLTRACLPREQAYLIYAASLASRTF